MRVQFIFTMVMCLIASGMTGCASTESSEQPKQAATPTISPEARTLLTQAEADINYARAKFALWTTAEAALKAAQLAAAAGDSAGVLRHAAFASSQVRLGIQQLDLPTTERK